MTDKTTLDSIAPYPKTAGEVTAEGLARHLTAFSHLHWRMAMDHPDQEKVRQSIGNAASHYGIAYLLREMPASEGDRVARELWETWESGHGVGVDLWGWLEEYGIDPQAVNGIAERLIAEDQAKTAEPASPVVQPDQVAVDAEDLKRVIGALARASHHWDGYRPEDHDAMARLRSSIPSGGA